MITEINTQTTLHNLDLRVLASIDREKTNDATAIALQMLKIARRTYLVQSKYDLEAALAISDREDELRKELLDDGNHIAALLSTLSIDGEAPDYHITLDSDRYIEPPSISNSSKIQ